MKVVFHNLKKFVLLLFLFISQMLWYGCSRDIDPVSPPVTPSFEKVLISYYLEIGELYDVVEVEKKSALVKPEDPVKENYVFKGWFKDSRRVRVFDFETERVDKNIALFAKWIDVEHKVIFDAVGGGEIEPREVSNNNLLDLPPNPEKPHSIFVDWYLDQNYSKSFSAELPIIQPITLYAKWNNKLYDFVFYSNGGTPIETKKVVSGATIAPPIEPSKDGFVFVGWYDSLKDDAEEFDFITTKIISRTRVFAKWTNRKIDIHFEAVGGEFIGPQGNTKSLVITINSQSRVTIPAFPIRDKYDFVGWYIDPNLSQDSRFNFLDRILDETTFYAKWELKSFKVTFTNLGPNKIPSQSLKIDEFVIKPADPSRYKGIFQNWYTSSSFQQVFDFNNTPITKNTTIYAYWTFIKTVTFDPGFGQMPDTQKTQDVIAEQPLHKPDDPTREGYSFAGWYVDSMLRNPYDFANSEVKIEFTLYAKWKSSTAILASMTLIEGENLTANFQNPTYFAEVKDEQNKIRLTAPRILLNSIKPRFVKQGVISSTPDLDSHQDFSKGPITYMLTAQDGTIIPFEVEISNYASPEKEMVLYEFRSNSNTGISRTYTASIDQVNHQINVQLPKEVAVDGLRPYIAHTGIRVFPVSGTRITGYSTTGSPLYEYTVTAEDGTSQIYTLNIKTIPSSDNLINNFSFHKSKNLDVFEDIEQPSIDGIINGNQINVTFPSGSKIDKLIPTIVISGNSISPITDSEQDFTNPVNYIVTAEDGKTNIYTVNVTVEKSSNNKILSFVFLQSDNPTTLTEDYQAVINQSANTITVDIPRGTNLNGLTPSIEFEKHIKDYTPKSSQDYNGTVRFIVRAEDTSTRVYTVIINQVTSSIKSLISFRFDKQDNSHLDKNYFGIIRRNHVYIDGLPYGADITALRPIVSILGGGYIRPRPLSPVDFTNDVIYKIYAQDNSFLEYIVSVNTLSNPSKRILSFDLERNKNSSAGVQKDIKGQIDGTDIILVIPIGVQLSSLMPTISYNGKSIFPESGKVVNFNTTKEFVVTGQDGNTLTYDIQLISVDADIKQITSFDFSKVENIGFEESLSGIINERNKTIIFEDVPNTADLTRMKPIISFKGRSISPESGEARDFSNDRVDYIIEAYDGSTAVYSVIVNVVNKDLKTINKFEFLKTDNPTLPRDIKGSDVNIDQSKKTIEITFPYGTDISNLMPRLDISGKVYDPNGAQNFGTKETPIDLNYVVYGEDNSSQEYKVSSVFSPNTSNDISFLSFSRSDNPSLTKTIVATISGTDITAVMPSETDISNIIPRITIDEDATISPRSGAPQNFDSEKGGGSVSYTVTAESGVSKTYNVSLSVAASDTKKITAFGFYVIDNPGVIPVDAVAETSDISDNTILVKVHYHTDLSKELIPRVVIEGNRYTPRGKVLFLEKQPVKFNVFAEDGSNEVYQVTVEREPQKNYTIIFDTRGGNDISNQTVADGQTIPSILPVRTDYVFAGWYEDPDKVGDITYRYDTTSPVYKHIKLYAFWIKAKRTINFYNEGTIFKTVTIDSGTSLKEPSDKPIKSSNSFVGWTLDPKTGVLFTDFNKTISTSFDLYAIFSAMIHKITYYSLGNPYTINMAEGALYQVPSNITNPGHTLQGWYEDQALTNFFDVSNSNNLVTGQKNLYAKWESDANKLTSIYFEYTGQKPTDPNIEGYIVDSSDEIIVSINGEYLSNLKLIITSSSNSTVSPTSGTILDFSSNNTQDIKVTSQSGKERTYTVIVKPLYKVTIDFKHPTDNSYPKEIQRVKRGDPITFPIRPLITGYTFEGYYTDSSYTNSYNSSPVIADANIYAKWKAQVFNVTFDSKGGTVVQAQQVPYGNKIDDNSINTTRIGYQFNYWKDDANIEFDVANKIIIEETNLSADWIPIYKVEFYLNDGVISPGISPNPIEIARGERITPPINNPTRKDYTFYGWVENIKNDVSFDFFNTGVIRDIDLYAKWESSLSKITSFTFTTQNGGIDDANDIKTNIDDTAKTIEVRVPSTVNLAKLTPTIAISPNSKVITPFDYNQETNFQNKVQYVIEAEDGQTTSVYEVTVIRYYQVSFNLNNGMVNKPIPIQLVNAGSRVSIPTENPTRLDFTFLEWHDLSNNTAYDFNQSVTKNIVLVVEWKSKIALIKEFKFEKSKNNTNLKGNSDLSLTINTTTNKITGITPFDNDLSSLVPTVVISKGASISPASGVVTDFTNDVIYRVTSEDGSVIKNYTVSLTPQYQVTFDLEGGSASTVIKNQIIARGMKATAPTIPTKSIGGHELSFMGWFEDLTSTTATAFNFTTTAINRNYSLKAKWAYTISFDTQSGVPATISDKNIREGMKATAPTIPTKSIGGHELSFMGWFEDLTSTTATAFNFTTTAINRNYSLKAKWTYTISFDTQSGVPATISDKNIREGMKATAPTIPTKSIGGHELSFMGWFEDLTSTTATAFNFTTTAINRNYSLKAKWAYTISFDTQSGVPATISDKNIREGMKATAPTIPTKSIGGHELIFMGWFEDLTSTTATAFNFTTTAINRNYSLKAKWTYTISFDTQSGVPATISDKNIREGMKATAPTIPTKSIGGHELIFMGWFEDLTSTTATAFNFTTTAINRNYSLKAKWTYTISFDTQSGVPATISDKKIREGMKATAPTIPTKSIGGHELSFMGWFEDLTSTTATAFNFTTTAINRNYSLKAKWAYTISFDTQSGVPATISDKNIREGMKATAPTIPTKSIGGHELSFMGWFEDLTSTTATAFNFTTTAINRNYSLKAKWTYTISFDTQSGVPVTISDKNIREGMKATAPTIPTKSIGGHELIFMGWFEDLTSTTATAFNFTTTAINRNYSLKAKWAYTISFDTQSGVPATISDKNIREGMKATAPTIPTKSIGGHELSFMGWFEDLTSTTATAFNFTTTAINRNYSLKAKWAYTISFDTQSGVPATISDKNIREGMKATAPTIPTKSIGGHELSFMGWFEDLTSTTATAFNFTTTAINRNYSLKAKWTYTISFDTQSGVPATISDKNIREGMKATAPTIPTKSIGGHELSFMGWFEDLTSTTATAFNFTTTAINRNYSLKAKWAYTISFDTQSGVPATISDKNIREGMKATAPTIPTKSIGGHELIFMGWFEDLTSTTATAFNFMTTAINRNYSLKAKWGYEVIFDANGGSFDVSGGGTSGMKTIIVMAMDKTSNQIVNNNKRSIPMTADLPFVYWYKDTGNASDLDTAFDFTTETITSDITLKALWGYKVTFDSNLGSFSNNTETKEVYTELKVSELTGTNIPTRKDSSDKSYTLVYWYKDTGNAIDLDTAFDFTTEIITSDITLKALWGYTITIDINGGESPDGTTENKEFQLKENSSLREPSSGLPIKKDDENNDMTIVYFYEDDKDSTTNNDADTAFDFTINNTLTRDVTLKILWGYTVTLDTDTGTPAIGQENPIKVGAGRTILATRLKSPIPPSGFSFVAWYDSDVTTNSSKTNFNTTTTIDKDITIKAKYGYTVIFDAAAGEFVFENPDGTTQMKNELKINVEDNSMVVVPIQATRHKTITNTDIFIIAWLDSSGYPFDFSNTSITSAITLTAVWGYSVTIDANGGSFNISGVTPPPTTYVENVPVGGMVVKPPNNPIRINYTLDYWYKDDGSANAADTPYDFTATIDQPITLKAKWSSQIAVITSFVFEASKNSSAFTNDITMQIDATTGLISNDEINAIISSLNPTITLSKGATIKNETFNNLVPHSFENTVVYTVTAEDGIHKKSYQVKIVPSYQIEFYEYDSTNPKGSVVQSSSIIRKGETVTEPTSVGNAPLSDSGNKFEGWYEDPDNNDEFLFNFSTAINRSIKLYPKYIATYKYTIEYDYPSGSPTSITQIVPSGEHLSPIYNPTFDGYTFDGWKTTSGGTTSYDFSNPVIGDGSIYGSWIAQTELKLISDNEFGKYLATLNNKNGVGALVTLSKGSYMLDLTEAVKVLNINLRSSSNRTKIQNIKEIKYFTNLERLDIRDTFKRTGNVVSEGIQEIDINNNTKLRTINANNHRRLKTIKMANAYSLTDIPDEAFHGCERLETIVFPKRLETIGEGAFQGAFAMNSNTNTGIDLIIPNSVKSIDANAFFGCSALTSVTISDSLTSISNSTFSGCSSLTSIIIPNSVERIGDYAFNGCSALTSVTISDRVTSIGRNAFFYCSSLPSVTIPNNVKSIGVSAFNGCSSLTSVTISDSLTSISNFTFNDCSALTSIIIPDSVTSIGSFAFENCSALTSVTIPDSVKSIGVSAFENCSSLTSVTISDNLTSISNSTFSGCSALTSIIIPDSVTSIGDIAFENCSSLTSIIIPNNVTSIGIRAFRDCSSLTSIIIPDSVTSIGEDAFRSCASLMAVTVPNGVAHIDQGVFYGCSALTSVIISSSVTHIDKAVFGNCPQLVNVRVEATTPPIFTKRETDLNIFTGTSSSLSITVPSASVESYKTADSWDIYASRITDH